MKKFGERICHWPSWVGARCPGRDMKLETGKPLMDGLYLVFVPAVVKSWLQPQIAMWHKGEWHHRSSTEKYPDDVQTWSGPIPVLEATREVPLPSPLEFDL